MEVPEVADLIWLFEAEPVSDQGEPWPVGLQSFRLARSDREVLFSVDPLAREAYVALYAGGAELASLGRLRRFEALRVVKGDGYEGLMLRFEGDQLDPVELQTRPVIRLSWNVRPLGRW